MSPTTPPPDLKLIAPFLQRAEETKIQNPVVSYWCTYHALQIALSLKFEKKDMARTLFLGNMMDHLEQEKQRLAKHDAITQSSVSSAYLENFALRVFTNADNEDRKGNTNRSTAKKFLAAANFLELLKIFEPLSQDIEEKIRYSKWKAADIARAFREGRQPQPGPPGGDETLSTASPLSSTLSPPDPSHTPTGSKTTSPQRTPENLSASPPSSADTITAPLPQLPTTPSASSRPISNNFITPKGTPMNPGLWSNTATPGGEFLHEDSPIKRPTFANRHAKFSEDDDAWSHAADIGSRQNSYRNPANTLDADDDANDISSSPLSTAMVSPPDPATQSHAMVKQVRWTPSVTGGSSTTSSPPPASPEMFHPTLDSLPERHIEEENGILDVHDPTPPELDTFIVSQQQAAPSSHHGHGHVDLYPSAPADEPHSPPAPLRNPFPTHTYIPSAPPPLPPPPAAMDVELTNAIIAKVQKHCRFAISSLDYEDAEQARKELRTALDLLGG